MTINEKPGVIQRPDLITSLPWREWIGEYLPGGGEGFNNTDLDMVINIFGPIIDQPYNASGRLMLIEVKTGYGKFNYGQRKTMSLLNSLLRKADPDHRFYRGFYLIQWMDNSVHVNEKITLSREGGSDSEFANWLLGEFEIDSYFKTKWDTLENKITALK